MIAQNRSNNIYNKKIASQDPKKMNEMKLREKRKNKVKYNI